ncbi:matrix-binding protein EbhB [Streptococcus suis]|uniref:phage tail spike protein n=1 Tax=Streptococcus suis TaxID=1307 RepID=UPI00211B85EC|nr:phage tail spike protein [Streptococcus suis]UUM55458.1 matrix-binding protein EbhB [Streptococcus suis]
MLYLLDKEVKTVKWNGIPLHEASSAIVKEEINGDFTLTIRYPITDSGIYQLIKEDMLIKAPVPVLGAQLFRIKKPVENDDSLDITAYHISDDVMQRSINPLSVVGQGCAMALSQMVQNAKTDLGTFSFTSDIMDSRTFNTTDAETLYSVLLDGKHSILGTWEGELVRDNFALTIKRSRGADRGVVITTHKNLKSYQRTKNSQSVVTRIHAKSTFKAEGADEETTITVTVDSPLIGNYPYINEKDYENNNAKTVDELRKWAEAKFKNKGIDKVSDAIEIEAYELDEQVIHLGDTVNIKSRKHNVDIHKKAIAYEYNALTEEYISITFDDNPGVGGSGVSSGVSNAADVILGVNANTQEIAVERAIKNANQAFDVEFEKRVEEINDGIEQSKAEAERYADQIKTEISQDFDAFEQEYQVTKQSQSRQIADILTKAQANTILATDAKNIGNQAKADAANVLSKALQYKNEAIAEATRLDTVERQATETKLATAKSQAISEATRLVETAKSLLSGQISNVSTDLSQTKEAIKLLATKATVDTLTGRVSSAEAMIQVQADQISQRVKTSDFDQAKQRISTAESSITQLGNRITTEISEIEVGGRNYFLNSDFSISSGNKGIAVHPDFMEHARGRKFIISVEVEGQNVVSQNQGRFGLSSSFAKGNTTARDWIEVWEKGIGNIPKKRIYQVFEFKDEWSDFRPSLFVQTGGEVTVGFPKLEIGSLVTDYSKAPEDFIADITTTKTLITQTAEGQQQLSTRLTETQGKVTTAETNIRQLVNDVSSKVSQTNFDNLKKIVDSQATTISQNQTAIALKAEKTYVDGVKTTADSAKSTANDALLKANANADAIKTTQAELKVTSDAVKTKVSSTDFDATKKRLETAETTIVTQAGEIEKRLTSTQVETAISNKGYQTKSDVDSNITGRGYITNSALQPYALSTTVQNLVKETSDSFSRTISETRALIPTSAGGRNYLLNSKTEISGGWASKTISLSQELLSNLSKIRTVTISCDVEGRNVTIRDTRKRFGLACSVEIDGKINYWEVWQAEDTIKKRISQTFTVPEGKTITKFYSPSLWIQADGNIKVSNPKLEFGVLPTDWSPAPEDYVTVTAFNTVTDTVNSHTRTLSEQGSSISQAVQTAQGLIARVENLSVGGRNYFLKSDFSISSGNKAIAIHPDFMKHAKGKKFVVSVEVEGKNVVFADRGRFGISTSGQRPGLTWRDWLEVWETGTGNIPKKRIYQVFSYIDDWMDFGANLYVQTGGEAIVGYPKLEIGIMPTDWSPAPEDGDQAIQAVSTQVSTLAGSWSVQNLNSSGDILSQANLSSDLFLLEAAKIRLKGKTLADEIQAIDGKFKTLFVADGTFAKLNATVIGSQAITADKLKVDQAFFDKLMANDAYLRQLFAKSVFTTQVQAVAVSAKQIAGGIAKALNGGMDVNFDESKINFYTNVAAIRRIYTGHPTQFIKFETEGNYSRTIIGSNRNGGEAFNSATFAGIVVENTNNINTEDSVKIYGDNTLLRHAQGDVGWNINSVTQRIVPANINEESEIWSKHFVAPDKNSKPVRLDTAVAALWDIWNHIIYNNFEFNEALRTHIKARRDNWKFELNL